MPKIVKLSKTGKPLTGAAAMDRKIGPRNHLKKPFLENFKKFGLIGVACDKTGVATRTVYMWRQKDADFRREFQESEARVVEVLENAAMKRAVTGTPVPVYQGGVKVGETQEYSDTLLIWLMKLRDKRYANLFKTKGDEKFFRELLENLVMVLKRNLPNKCPGCGTLLDLFSPIGRDLISLSKKFSEET